jgi:hypothetical protein
MENLRILKPVIISGLNTRLKKIFGYVPKISLFVCFNDEITITSCDTNEQKKVSNAETKLLITELENLKIGKSAEIKKLDRIIVKYDSLEKIFEVNIYFTSYSDEKLLKVINF